MAAILSRPQCIYIYIYIYVSVLLSYLTPAKQRKVTATMSAILPTENKTRHTNGAITVYEWTGYLTTATLQPFAAKLVCNLVTRLPNKHVISTIPY